MTNTRVDLFCTWSLPHTNRSWQLKDEYHSINPMRELPALIIDGYTLTQSVSPVHVSLSFLLYRTSNNMKQNRLKEFTLHYMTCFATASCENCLFGFIFQNERMVALVGHHWISRWNTTREPFTSSGWPIQASGGKFLWTFMVLLLLCVFFSLSLRHLIYFIFVFW